MTSNATHYATIPLDDIKYDPTRLQNRSAELTNNPTLRHPLDTYGILVPLILGHGPSGLHLIDGHLRLAWLKLTNHPYAPCLLIPEYNLRQYADAILTP
jgi:hypothetical protein